LHWVWGMEKKYTAMTRKENVLKQPEEIKKNHS
jgi:hypothetical protein